MDHYVIISLPFTKATDQQQSAQFTYWQRAAGDVGSALRNFNVPQLKVGTLDSLMEASDDLAKLDPLLEGTVMKLSGILEEASGKPRSAVCMIRINQNTEMTSDEYIKHFLWNNQQFDTKENIRVLNEKLAQVASNAEDRIRGVVTEYSDTRNKLLNLTRKGQGNLATRSINDVVNNWVRSNRGDVLNTEFLQTIFVAVPSHSVKEFLDSYWQIHEYVAPKSATIVAEDKEFSLYSVVVFKRAAEDFKQGCRKRKYMVRELEQDDGDTSTVEQLQAQVEQQRSSLISLLSQQFTLCFMAWMHVKTLRVFVESMLKYGVPPKFVPILLAVDHSKEKALRKRLSEIVTDLHNPLADDTTMDTGALQYEYPYVSLKITNIAKEK